MSNDKLILYKNELEDILELHKKGEKYGDIAKKFGRTYMSVRNEIFKYVKEAHLEGESMLKLSKNFNFSLEEIKNIIDNTKLLDRVYIHKNKMPIIIEMLKKKKKYSEIYKCVATTRESLMLYIKRYISEDLKNKNIDDVSSALGIKIEEINKIMNKKKIVNKLAKLSLKQENDNLKNTVDELTKIIEINKIKINK